MSDRSYYNSGTEMQANQDQIASIIVFLVVGLAIGAVLALMFAPDSGEKTRKNLAKTVEDALPFMERPDPTTQTIRRLEKEFADLRHRVEERMR
ncbi:MAG: YtxH domain-containing protein [Anaerolineae bacterium]|nr:YtxH domain-containing protein [Anaerolineae bacterium]